MSWCAADSRGHDAPDRALYGYFGADCQLDLTKAMHRNVTEYTRSGAGPVKNVARGETAIGVGFLALAAGEAKQGFPIKSYVPWQQEGSATCRRSRHARSESGEAQGVRAAGRWVDAGCRRVMRVTSLNRCACNRMAGRGALRRFAGSAAA